MVKASEYQFELSGGRPCLDFANTLGDRPHETPSEHLNDYEDLLAWSRQSGVLDEKATRRLAREAAGRPQEAARVFRRAIALREAIYRIFSALAARVDPADADLEQLNEELAAALAHSRIDRAPTGFAWSWSDDAALDRMLWPVVRSAAELLSSPEELRAVRECASPTCGWLFLDRSKNASRRWCDMKVCGNREKARRHYRRAREA